MVGTADLPYLSSIWYLQCMKKLSCTEGSYNKDNEELCHRWIMEDNQQVVYIAAIKWSINSCCQCIKPNPWYSTFILFVSHWQKNGDGDGLVCRVFANPLGCIIQSWPIHLLSLIQLNDLHCTVWHLLLSNHHLPHTPSSNRRTSHVM